MPSVKEYRCPLPMTLEEYRTAQLYMVAKFSKESTQAETHEGVEILANQPYDDGKTKGQYTKKILRMGSRIPDWIKSVIPENMLKVQEESWNAYPYCKTVYSNPLLGDKMSIIQETRYLADDGSTENAVGLTEEQLKERVVDFIDIVSDPVDPAKYKPEEDPQLWVSQKTGRGKLQPGWIKAAKEAGTIMCSYKVTTIQVSSWIFASRLENWVHDSVIRAILVLAHRKAFCWLDEWYGLTIEDIRAIEEETKRILDERLQETKAIEEAAVVPTVNAEGKSWFGGWLG